MQVIAFTGLRGSGKDTAAAFLIDAFGFNDLKFAGPLKAMLTAFYVECGVDADTIHQKLEGDLKEVSCEWLGGRTPRHAMQTLGTEWRNTIHYQLWSNLFKLRVRSGTFGDKIVCSDLRFPHEVEMLRELDALLVRIERPHTVLDDYSLHPSESQMQSLDVDVVLHNDASVIEFEDRVMDLIAWHQGARKA